MKHNSVVSIADVEAIALQKASKITQTYWQNGAGDNQTIHENVSAYDHYRIRPRILRNVQDIDMSATVLGHRYNLPIGIAPSGWHKLADPVGEAGTARAAKVMGTCMGVSMGTCVGEVPTEICSPEEVKEAGGTSVQFFQLYMFQKRELSRLVLRRAEAAGYEAVMLTVDSAVPGRRLAEMRVQPFMPRVLRMKTFGMQLDDALSAEDMSIDPGLVWNEAIPWLRHNTKMQIWLKGILTGEDAALAVQHQVDGIIVSNHGGRQLDGCITTLEALPEVVAAVRATGSSMPVHMDGGIRKGGDVFRALALGANYVWIGRPVLWGLAYNGQRGVEHVLSILRDDLESCMGLSGCKTIEQIDKSHLRLAEPPRARL
jgi:(S)-2-hydroxy-acid oxidase